jgi:hypothetical protein
MVEDLAHGPLIVEVGDDLQWAAAVWADERIQECFF